MENEVTWDLALLSLSKRQTELAFDLQLWLESSSSDLAKSIANMQGGVFSTEEMRFLEQLMILKFRPLVSAAEMLKLLCKVVDAINQVATNKLPNPSIPNLRIRPTNPFHYCLPLTLARVRKWREAVAYDMQEMFNKDQINDDYFFLGKLLTTAILHGGLGEASLMIAFVKALLNPTEKLIMIQNRLMIELSIAWQGEAGSEHRLWYPDPLTATLIAKLPERLIENTLKNHDQKLLPDIEIRKTLWKCISRYMRLMNNPLTDRPQNLTTLLRSVHEDLQTRLPIILANYSSRKTISHSPAAFVIKRLFGYSSQYEQSEENVSSQPAELITSFNQMAEDLDDLEPSWLAEIRKAFSLTSHAEVISNLDNLVQKQTNDIAYACFLGFARHLVTSNSASGNKLALSTAKAYIVTVAKRLGGRLAGLDPIMLDVDTLESIYIEILEDADQESGLRNQKRNIARALREFHHYLVHRYNFVSINVRDVLGIGKGLIPVDANLIQLDEFYMIHDAIPSVIQDLHPTLTGQSKLIKSAQLIFMLSFRCGLRRMEVLKLKTVDLSEAHPAELLIRPSTSRRLKTKSSTRKIPLYALLNDDEIASLVEWKNRRLSENNDGVMIHEQFLFGIPELNFVVIPQDTLFPIIHHAMRAVTKDGNLRFHHLRHSFATWTFLRLMLSDLPTIPIIFPDQPSTQTFLNESKTFREKLYGRSGITRRHVYAVASLLGHSGPEISLEHYIHCCDVLLAIWLQQDISSPKVNLIRLQSGRPQSTAYRWKLRGSFQTPYRLIKRRWPILFPKKFVRPIDLTVNQLTKSALDKDIFDDPDIFDTIHKVLFQHGMHGVPLISLANEFGISESHIQSMYTHICVIRDMRVTRGAKGYRHRMNIVVQDRREPKNSIRLACPVAPHSVHDINISNELAPKFLNAIKTNPDLCQQVFDYYLENAWQTRNELVFKDPQNSDDALKFLEFLNLLGIKKSALQFVSYDTAKRSVELARWKDLLALSSRHYIKKLTPPRRGSVSAKKWLGIKPVFTDNPHLTVDNQEEPEGSIAFRYLMVLGSAMLCAMLSSEDG